MSVPLLATQSIVKSYAAIEALKGVSFDVYAGEVHALVGENGAGKSTLIRVMTGAETPDAGQLLARGHIMSALTPTLARRLGIAVVHQQPALFPDLTVAENLALGTERTGWHIVDWGGRRRRARDLLSRVGASIDPDRAVETLTTPEQQLVEIARALGTNADVLILDEPTASLTAHEVEALLDVLRRLSGQGVGVVYISHRLDEVLAVADRVTVLRDGRTVGTLTADGLQPRDVVRLMVGDELHDPPPRSARPDAEVVCELRNVSNRSAGVHDASLSIRAGEIVGLAGLTGSGRTQLAETVFGITPGDGDVFVNGKLVTARTPGDAMRAGIAYVPEDRRRHGVVLKMSIAANTTMARLRAVTRRGLIDRRKEREVALGYVERLRIKADSPLAAVETLSGGNQQKVAVARWLMTRPSVLILDEPTQGVDVRSKGEIHRIVRELADQGLAILLISSDLPELLSMSDRVAVMRGGIVAAVIPGEEASPHALLTHMLGTAGHSAERS